MRLSELISLLQDVQGDLPGDAPDPEVRLAMQPSWPLAFDVAGASALEDEDGDTPPVVWIAAGSHPRDASPYAPSEAWEL